MIRTASPAPIEGRALAVFDRSGSTLAVIDTVSGYKLAMPTSPADEQAYDIQEVNCIRVLINRGKVSLRERHSIPRDANSLARIHSPVIVRKRRQTVKKGVSSP